MKSSIITVSQLLRFVKSLVDDQKQLTDVLVRGEISDVAFRSISGHLYFSLTDSDMTIRCVMFSKYASRLANFPKAGSMVLVRGAVTIYERDGSVQVIVYDIQELGSGLVKKNTEDIKQKLAAEGLFDSKRKKQFSPFPKAVGVITSPDGAAVQDIITTFRLHNPLVKIIVYPATMQGAAAVSSIIASLRTLQDEGICQSCVIARGGGSADDLSTFNSEELARAVAACVVPIVSAVGHEIDYTIADLVADARAATPTAACKILSRPSSEYIERIKARQQQLERCILQKLSKETQKVQNLQKLLEARSPEVKLNNYKEKYQHLLDLLNYKISTKLTNRQIKVKFLLDKLELINPVVLLKKGYSLTINNGRIIDSTDSVQLEDRLVTRVSDGTIISKVTEVCKEG